jgi:hypothetical protein
VERERREERMRMEACILMVYFGDSEDVEYKE